MRYSLAFISLALVVLATRTFAAANSVGHAARSLGNGQSRRHVVARNFKSRTEQGHNETSVEKRDGGTRFSWFTPDGVQLACGGWQSSSDFIVAMNVPQWNGGSWCGKTLTLTWGGKTAQAKVADECQECPYGGLDLTPALFSFFGGSTDPGYLWGGSWDEAGAMPSPTLDPKPSTTSKPQPPSPTSHQAPPSSSVSSHSSVTSSSQASSSSSAAHSSASSASATSAQSSSVQASPSPSASTLGNIDLWMLAYVQLAGLAQAAVSQSK